MKRRCPDTGQILNFPADCGDCEFMTRGAEMWRCGWHIKQPKHRGKRR